MLTIFDYAYGLMVTLFYATIVVIIVAAGYYLSVPEIHYIIPRNIQ